MTNSPVGDSTSVEDRYRGAALGALIGDALAMPAHWFYDPVELKQTFGRIDRFIPPPARHPGSILWRSRYEPTEPEYDILGDQRQYWGQSGVHYHQFLRAGENTLNLKLLCVALDQVAEHGTYSVTRFLTAYQEFMLHPELHHDTYVEECHRGFFENLRAGRKPEKAAVKEKHIGGMVAVLPLYLALRHRDHTHADAQRLVLSHVALTHAGRQVADAAKTLLRIAAEVVDGRPLSEALTEHLRRQDLPFLQGPLLRHVELTPDRVLGRVYSTACYLEDSLPATFYLALRYTDDPSEGLIANTMAGGDNCHRGAVLGALFGFAGGTAVFPAAWREGLVAEIPE